jgi:hypothetical protein
MKITKCLLGNSIKCSKCRKVTLCGSFRDMKGKYTKKGGIIFLCQDCVDGIEFNEKIIKNTCPICGDIVYKPQKYIVWCYECMCEMKREPLEDKS